MLSFPEATELDVITWDSTPASAYRTDSAAHAPFRERSYYYCVIPMFRRRIEDLDAYVSANTHIWTHAPWHDDLPAELLGNIPKRIYILRDPRDVLISAAHYVDTEYCRREFGIPRIPLADRYERLLKGCVEWAVHVAGWVGHADQANLHIVSYEGLVTDLHLQLTRMSEYLELGLDERQIVRVAEAASFGSMKTTATGGHVRKGVVGNWRRELPAETAVKATRLCHPLIDLFGYSDLERGISSFLSHGEVSDEIRTALAGINRLQYSAQPKGSPPITRSGPGSGNVGQPR